MLCTNQLPIIFSGNKQQIKTTVFNDQSLVQIGGRLNTNLRRIDRPFVGIIAGAVYNGLRPLDLVTDGTRFFVSTLIHLIHPLGKVIQPLTL